MKTFRIIWTIVITINILGIMINAMPPFGMFGFIINVFGLVWSIYKLYDTWDLD